MLIGKYTKRLSRELKEIILQKVIDDVYTIIYTEYEKEDDFMQATIQKWETSQGIRIPKAFLEALVTLEDIFKDYDGEYVRAFIL